MDTGEPHRRHPRPHPQRQRLHRRVPPGRGAGHRRRRGHRRPLHRYRAGAGPDDPPLRLDAPTTTTSSPRAPSPATSSSAARSAPAATARWIGRTIPDMANIGYPIVEADPDGSFAVTKHARGGRPGVHRFREGAIALRTGRPPPLHHARLRRRLHHHPARGRRSRPRAGQRHSRAVRGRPRSSSPSPTPTDGRPSAHWSISWPQALEKARAADHIVRRRLERLGLAFDEIYTEFFGVNACHGPARPAESRSARGATAHRRARSRTGKPSTVSRAN